MPMGMILNANGDANGEDSKCHGEDSKCLGEDSKCQYGGF